MKQRQLEKPNWTTWLFLSAALHLFAVVIYFLVSTATPIFTNERHIIAVNIVQKGKPRDEKLLPRQVADTPKSEEEPAKPAPVLEPPPPPQKHAIKVEKPEPKPSKSHPKTSSKTNQSPKKNPLDALEKRLKALEKEGKADGLDYGNSVTGELTESYGARIVAVLKENFTLPSFISAKEARLLMVRLKIRIDAEGKPLQVLVTHPSGNASYDDAVLANAKGVESFGPPPLPLRKQLRAGVEIELCPFECQKKE
jgi:outer membrane biosynthesis protein TonB